jgi:hypothetical protein
MVTGMQLRRFGAHMQEVGVELLKLLGWGALLFLIGVIAIAYLGILAQWLALGLSVVAGVVALVVSYPLPCAVVGLAACLAAWFFHVRALKARLAAAAAKPVDAVTA